MLSLPERGALPVPHGALDAGINLVDTAPSYGLAEERIGRYLAGRRHEFVLSTKCGYGVLFDQRVLEHGLPFALERGPGFIAKRPLGNAPWRFTERPHSQDVGAYWERMQALALDSAGLPWEELAPRFVAFTPGVPSCIVGTTRLENLRRNLQAVARGPLHTELLERIHATFRQHGAGWESII